MDRTPDSAGTNRNDPAPGASGPTAEQAGIDSRLDERRSRGVSGATWTALILGLLILILLLVFILQNNVPADFEYMAWEFSLPLGVAMLLAAIAGALVMALVGSVRLFALGHRLRRLEKEREDIKRALG